MDQQLIDISRGTVTSTSSGELANSANAPGGGQEGNRKVLSAIRARTFPITKDTVRVAGSQSVPTDDILARMLQQGRIVEPPFDPLVLSMLPEHSTELRQCLDAMVTNIEAFGFRLDSRVRVEDPDCPPALKKEVRKEYVRIYNFLRNCVIRGSLTKLRCITRENLETNGYSFWEIIRNATNTIDAFNHLKVHEMRLARLDPEPVEVDVPRLELQEDGSVSIGKVRTPIYFRRFVQVIGGVGGSSGRDVRWFKEFGDPRVIDNRTGEVVPADQIASFPNELRASEVYHWKHQNDRTPYGVSRLIGNLLTIFGDRAADEINFITLKNNNIPSMAVLVSGGQATEGTIARIQEFTTEVMEGSGNYSRFLLLEAETPTDALDASTVKIELKPLVDVQTRDSMFQKYQANNADKIRRLFRLPPIFVGRADDYSKATAESSRKLADEQIFAPERQAFDEVMNGEFFPHLNVKYHRFVSMGPNVTDDQDLINVLSVAEKTGGMDPVLARQIIGDILNRELGPPRGIDPDKPFSMQMAEAVKNQADMRVGTQVTALKDTGAGTRDLIIDDEVRGEIRTELRKVLKGEMRGIVRDLLMDEE